MTRTGDALDGLCRCLCPVCSTPLTLCEEMEAKAYRCPACRERVRLSWYRDLLGTRRPLLTTVGEVAPWEM